MLKYSLESFVFGLIVDGFLSRLQLAGQTVIFANIKNNVKSNLSIREFKIETNNKLFSIENVETNLRHALRNAE